MLGIGANASSSDVAVEGSPELDTGLTASSRNSRLRNTGINLEILRTFAIIFFPLSALSVALIIIVQVLRIQKSELPSLSVLNPGVEESEAGAYFVRVNSSTLTLLASYCSSIAPILATFVMILLSYPISRHLLSISESRNEGELPTPYQVGLLITLLNGDLGGLWNWLKYTFVWHKRRKLAAPVIASAFAFLIALFLGYSPKLFLCFI